jgi:hypothetical protein
MGCERAAWPRAVTTKLALALATVAGCAVDELQVSPMDGNDKVEKKRRSGHRLLRWTAGGSARRDFAHGKR